MGYFLLILISLNVFAAEDPASIMLKSIRDRKEAIRSFREQVTLGKKCPPRDFDCFDAELARLWKGHGEEIASLRGLIEPFYQRSLKEGFPPCEAGCQQNMLASYIMISLKYLRSFYSGYKKSYRVDLHPTVSVTKIRALLDLSAFHHQQKHLDHVKELVKNLDLSKVTIKELKDPSVYKLDDIDNGLSFLRSVLCQLSPGDPIYNDIVSGKTKADETYRLWMKEFDETGRKVCRNSTPLVYKGTDSRTREYYGEIFSRKLAEINCEAGDYACVRRHLRRIGIRYSSEVPKVAEFMKSFVEKSKGPSCNDTCQAQNLVKTLQTWISYFSTFERVKFASTMDWKEYPKAKFATLTEDIDFYSSLKEIFTPLLSEFGKIDPRSLKDPGLKSEMRSLSKDLSDLASGQMLKDSVICTMEPWKADYDRYMTPFEEKSKNKKFEADFLEFKASICK